MCGAELDGGLEIGGHPHRQELEPVALRDLRQEREMRCWRLIEGRDAHHPFDRQPVLASAGGYEAVGLLRRDTGLLRFLARVHLHEEARAAPLKADLLGERRGDRWAVDAVDGVEMRHRL